MSHISKCSNKQIFYSTPMLGFLFVSTYKTNSTNEGLNLSLLRSKLALGAFKILGQYSQEEGH